MSRRHKKVDYSRPPTQDEVRRAEAKLQLLKPKLLREYDDDRQERRAPPQDNYRPQKNNPPPKNKMNYESYLDEEEDDSVNCIKLINKLLSRWMRQARTRAYSFSS